MLSFIVWPNVCACLWLSKLILRSGALWQMETNLCHFTLEITSLASVRPSLRRPIVIVTATVPVVVDLTEAYRRTFTDKHVRRWFKRLFKNQLYAKY